MWVRNANGPLDGAQRRSVYQETRRNFLSPLMVNFDLPIPDTTVGRRNLSNVPAQALALMNDPFVRNQSSAWARRLLAEVGNDATERIGHLYRQAFGRTPTPEEIQALQGLLTTQTQQLASLPDGPDRDIRLWTEVCHALFMTQEFAHVP
jgi:putative heme iron utilization protein